MDAGLKDVVYEPTPEELEGIDRGLRDAAEGRFATDEEVEAAFAKFRRK
jgi:predicted transcriptional regulator